MFAYCSHKQMIAGALAQLIGNKMVAGFVTGGALKSEIIILTCYRDNTDTYYAIGGRPAGLVPQTAKSCAQAGTVRCATTYVPT